MSSEQDVSNEIIGALQQEEESEAELMRDHSHAGHRLRSLARGWQVDIAEVTRISRSLKENHDRRVEELRAEIARGRYIPDNHAVAETLILGEVASH